MAASRTAPAKKSTARTASGRISFGKIREPLEVPDLLALQTDSFDWLLGNERWQARVAAALETGRTEQQEQRNQHDDGFNRQHKWADLNLRVLFNETFGLTEYA